MTELPPKPNGSSPATEPADVGEAINQAIASHRSGDLDRAEELYRGILQALPGNAHVLHMFGVLCNQRGRHQEAVDLIGSAMIELADDPSVHNNRGNALRKLGRLDDAAAAFRNALTINPDYAVAHNNLASLLIDQGDFGAAEESCRAALELNPESAAAYSNLGNILTALGRADEALDCLDRAVAIDPDLASAHNNRAQALIEAGRSEESMAALQRALALDPNMIEAANNLGLALLEEGRPEDALGAFEFAIGVDPDFAVAHNNCGTAHDMLKQSDEAMECYRRAAELSPELAEAQSNLGNALKAAGQFKEAVAACRRAAQLDPGNAKAQANLGDALMQDSDIDGATDNYFRALEIDPDLVEIYNKIAFPLAMAEERQRDDGDSDGEPPLAAWLGKLRSGDPDSPFPHLTEFFVRSFTPEAALDACNTVIDRLVADEGEAVQFTGAGPHSGSADAPAMPGRSVALVHFGRSGSGFLHSLIDGHSQVTTTPGVYMNGFFGNRIWDRIRADSPELMAERFCRLYEVLFDARIPKPVPGVATAWNYQIGVSEGFAAMGDDQRTVLGLDRGVFKQHLVQLLMRAGEVNQGRFFELVHVAFEQAIGRPEHHELLFYHLHNPSIFEFCRYLGLFPESKILLIVRDPIESCTSWIRPDSIHHQVYDLVVNKLVGMLYWQDRVEIGLRDSAAIGLEKLKDDPRGTMRALCAWLGIDEEETLYTPTMQGLRWWGDPSSSFFGKDDQWRKQDPKRLRGTGFFSERDRFVLDTLFYPFNALHGYVADDQARFKEDLAAIRPMIEEPFDFEVEYFKADRGEATGDPRRHVMYEYFRMAMRSRWRVLDRHGTYPGLIQPLPAVEA